MSESYREQFPLLCDDLSDEEHYSPQYYRQYRQMSYRSRTRSNVKGAVAILKRWPEHWTSFLTYWWVGVVMICLMTFILYNSLFAFSILPTADFKPIRTSLPKLTTTQFKSSEASQFYNVFVHIFTENEKNIDLNKYLPHLDAIARHHASFNYYLLVVLNDTLSDHKYFSAETNNANALNSLWAEDIKKDKTTAGNIKIKYISLTQYLDNSPISKHWRMLPSKLIEFFVRAVSIWDKGGITFNPNILSSSSPSSPYLKKLENIFETFQHSEVPEFSHKQSDQLSNVSKQKIKPKVNNIRDIINNLEHENNVNIEPDEILVEAESKHVGNILGFNTSNKSIHRNNHTNKIISKRGSYNAKLLSNSDFDHQNTQQVQSTFNDNSTSSLTILPSFLEYLFHRNAINDDKDDLNVKHADDVVSYSSKGQGFKSNLAVENKTNNIIAKNISNLDETSYRPMIILPNAANMGKINNKFRSDVSQQYGNDKFNHNLTIDLKGNLLATKTACHAFLGTIFTDAVHFSHEETLSDFLIRELSVFCKGVLSSCSGIDLIL